MDPIQDNTLQGLGTAPGSSTATGSKAPARLGQEQFLELMIAQLKNQDPTKPLQSGEFLSQMAQFSTVSGIQDLQTSFHQLAGTMYSNQALQASALVGRMVLVPSDKGVLPANGAMSGTVDLPAGTNDLTVEVYDASGQLVRRIPLGGQAAGLVSFNWDGAATDGSVAAPGTYYVKARARFDGQDTAVTALAATRVDSVSLGGAAGGISLNLNGLGAMDLAQVRQIM